MAYTIHALDLGEDALSNQGLTARRSQQQTLEYQPGKHGLRPTDIGHLLHTHVDMDRLNVARLIHDLWGRVEILDEETEPFAAYLCLITLHGTRPFTSQPHQDPPSSAAMLQ
jgi:hypothetical protein